MKYKHVVLHHTGGPTVFQIVEDELPEPGPNEVRVKILAAGVSFSEVLMRHGQYPGAPAMPFTPGYDMVGVVEKLGTGVSAFEMGEMVAALTVYGGYSQYICLPEEEGYKPSCCRNASIAALTSGARSCCIQWPQPWKLV